MNQKVDINYEKNHIVWIKKELSTQIRFFVVKCIEVTNWKMKVENLVACDLVSNTGLKYIKKPSSRSDNICLNLVSGLAVGGCEGTNCQVTSCTDHSSKCNHQSVTVWCKRGGENANPSSMHKCTFPPSV